MLATGVSSQSDCVVCGVVCAVGHRNAMSRAKGKEKEWVRSATSESGDAEQYTSK